MISTAASVKDALDWGRRRALGGRREAGLGLRSMSLPLSARRCWTSEKNVHHPALRIAQLEAYREVVLWDNDHFRLIAGPAPRRNEVSRLPKILGALALTHGDD